MAFRVLPEIFRSVSRSLFISGGTRTGSTIVANLIHSLEKVECFNEPPFLYALMFMIHSVPESEWKFLFESFMVEELLLPALAGRNLNFNKHDESYILNSLSQAEIDYRLSRTHRHFELLPRSASYRLAFKMPDTVTALTRLRSYYPEISFLVMLRRPEKVIASLLERGWYSDRQLVEVGGNWVFRDTQLTDRNIPAWVPESLVEEFLAASELDRCAMCYMTQYRELAKRTDCIVVDYDRLIAKPHDYFAAVVDRLGERFGERTEALLDTIRDPGRHKPIDLDLIAPARLVELRAIYEECRGLAVSLE